MDLHRYCIEVVQCSDITDHRYFNKRREKWESRITHRNSTFVFWLIFTIPNIISVGFNVY